VTPQRRYRLRPNTSGLPIWAWVFIVLGLVAGIVGLALTLTDHDPLGSLLMALSGMTVGGSLLVDRVLTDYSNDRRSSTTDA